MLLLGMPVFVASTSQPMAPLITIRNNFLPSAKSPLKKASKARVQQSWRITGEILTRRLDSRMMVFISCNCIPCALFVSAPKTCLDLLCPALPGFQSKTLHTQIALVLALFFNSNINITIKSNKFWAQKVRLGSWKLLEFARHNSFREIVK